MPPPDTTPPPPELLVLDALKETCEQVRRHNACPEVAKAALEWETRITRSIAKLQPEGAALVAQVA